jgi:hypothetical protein
MSGRSLRLAGRFFGLGRNLPGNAVQAGDGPPARTRNAVADLTKSDLADIAECAKLLPGTWHIDTSKGAMAGDGSAWLRSLGDKQAPAFGIARSEGVLMVRMSRPDGARSRGPLIFGVFGSIVEALDAIQIDIASRRSSGHRKAAAVS